MLAPSVERRRKDAAALPVYRLLVGSRGPDRSFAFTAQYIDDFFEQIPLRLGATARWNVTNIGAIDAFTADQPYVSSRYAEPSPWFHLERAQVRHRIAGNHGNVFGIEPVAIGVLIGLIGPDMCRSVGMIAAWIRTLGVRLMRSKTEYRRRSRHTKATVRSTLDKIAP
jgi:hypothetical protein